MDEQKLKQAIYDRYMIHLLAYTYERQVFNEHTCKLESPNETFMKRVEDQIPVEEGRTGLFRESLLLEVSTHRSTRFEDAPLEIQAAINLLIRKSL